MGRNPCPLTLGHGGGGATTLRVYTAWTSEADQRAARTVSGRMPTRPSPSMVSPGLERRDVQPPVDEVEEQHPYQKIASDLRGAIESGILAAGDALPAEKTIAARYGVAASTAHRAIELLVKSGLVRSASGQRTLVATTAPEGS